MSINFFIENYDLKENKVIKAEIKNNKLVLSILMNAHLELIANGYRPEMSLDIVNKFAFDTNHKNRIYDKDVNLSIIEHDDTKIVFNINGDIIECVGDIKVQ